LRTTTTFGALAAALALGAAGCGGSSSSSSSNSSGAPASTTATAQSSASAAGAGPGGGAVKIAADPSGGLRFQQTSVTASAGRVSIQFTNSAPEGHNLTLQRGDSGPEIGATATFTGGSRTLTVNLKPGRYTFFCSVPGHRAGGMQGVLVVR
jgi:plastocyanin